MRTLVVVSMFAAAAAAQSPCNAVSLAFSPGTIHAGEPGVLVITGAPDSFSLVGIDLDAGPTIIPGIGTVHLGLSPAMAVFGVFLPPSGRFEHVTFDDCKAYTLTLHAQALTLDFVNNTSCLSNPTQLHIQNLGQCSPPHCILNSAIGSGFNGTPIAAGRSVWFNAVVKLSGVPANGATVAYRNAHIDFDANGQHYSLPVPNSVITVSPVAIGAATTFDPVANQFDTGVPTFYSGNIFLSGCSFPAPVGLPGGIGPVTWSGEFLATQPGIGFQWKWAAAVYIDFSTDYNQLGVKTIDGNSVLNAYPNAHHAGTPENFAAPSNCVGGARGGGSSNFTGSYSGTTTTVCQ